jgi:hypothetical protein
MYRKPNRSKLETVEYLKSMQHTKLDGDDISVHRGGEESRRSSAASAGAGTVTRYVMTHGVNLSRIICYVMRVHQDFYTAL